jgi:hypothetical protein
MNVDVAEANKLPAEFGDFCANVFWQYWKIRGKIYYKIKRFREILIF